MKIERLHRLLATSLVMVGGLLLLTGCGGVAGGGSGTGGAVQLGSASLNFGTVAIGTSKTLPDSISNNTSASVTISSIQGTGSGFTVTGLSLPLVLAAGQTTPFSVQFQPANAGDPAVTIVLDGQNAQAIVSLTATATAVTNGTLSPSPSQIAFGDTTVGSNQASTVTLANSGGTDLSITQATLSGAGFSMSNLALPLTIHAGGSAPVTITFAPTATGNFSGSVTFAVTASQLSSQVVLPFTGAGVVESGTLSPNPASLAFGSVQVGNSGSQSETLTNTGEAAVTISQANLTGAAFSISGLNLPLDLAASHSVTFTATFTPTSAGAASGSLSVVSNASNSPLSIALSGTGTAAGQLAVSPTSLGFGSVAVGSNSQLTGTLTASGATVTVASATSSNNEFAISGISFPATVTVGQPVTFTVTFTPASSGAASASLSFASNASNSPTVESLTGTGTAQTQHSVDLSWNASADAVSYNIYRGAASGGPYTKVNTSPIDPTAYTDSTVVSGQTYYYVATAVNSESDESGYSNQATAVVPNP